MNPYPCFKEKIDVHFMRISELLVKSVTKRKK